MRVLQLKKYTCICLKERYIRTIKDIKMTTAVYVKFLILVVTFNATILFVKGEGGKCFLKHLFSLSGQFKLAWYFLNVY